jgi:hypothetical protein
LTPSLHQIQLFINVEPNTQDSNTVTAMDLPGRGHIFMPCFSRKMWMVWKLDTQKSSLLACKAVRFQTGTQGFLPRTFGGKSEIDCWICWLLMVLWYNDVVTVCCIKCGLFTVTIPRKTTSEMKCFISPGVQIPAQWQVTILLDSRVILSSSFLFVGISCVCASQYSTASPKF